MTLVACKEQQTPQEVVSGSTEQNPSDTSSVGDVGPQQRNPGEMLAARLAKGDPTICTDEAVHSLLVAKSLRDVDAAAAGSYQLLLDKGGSLELVGARFIAAEPEAGEVTCSATVPRALYSDEAFPFTYTLRPDRGSDDIVVDPEGSTARWFHFRGAIVSKLHEMELLEASKRLEALRSQRPEPEPQAPVTSEEPQSVPADDGAGTSGAPATGNQTNPEERRTGPGL